MVQRDRQRRISRVAPCERNCGKPFCRPISHVWFKFLEDTFPEGVTLGGTTDVPAKNVPLCPPIRSLASASPRQKASSPGGRGTVQANLARTVLSAFMARVAGLLVPCRSPAQPTKALGAIGGAFNFDGTVHVRVPNSAALKTAQINCGSTGIPYRGDQRQPPNGHRVRK